MSTYQSNLGFLAPSDASADLNALSSEAHEQLEAFLLEGAEAGAQTGDPVLLAWFAAADASLAPWHLTNCGDYNWNIDYDCDVLPWGSNIWQVGLGTQVSDQYGDVAKAFAWAHPQESPEAVGNEVLTLAAQSKTFPANTSVATLAGDPGQIVDGMHASYWVATLERDMAVSAYLESPPATQWPCYVGGAPGWCGWYREQQNWQHYSDVLQMTINSWNEILDSWKKDLVPDVIVDDVSSGFTVSGSSSADGSGGWRGRYAWAAASASPTATGTWTAQLPFAGTYAVSAFLPFGSHATESTAKIVVHATDGDHAVVFDEAPVGGHFVALGTFPFGTTAKATMTNVAGAGTFVGWDALRFHLVQADAAPDGGLPEGGTVAEGGATRDAELSPSPDGGMDDAAGGPGDAPSSGASGCACRAGAETGRAGWPAVHVGIFASILALLRRRRRDGGSA